MFRKGSIILLLQHLSLVRILNKVSSLLGSVNTSLDKQKSVLDDISDTLAKSRYDQPKTSFSGNEDSGSNLGRTNIGPVVGNKSPEQEKTEHDLKHNVGEAIKEGFEYVLKGAGLGGGAWGFNKLFGGAKAATPLVEGAVSRCGAATAAPTAETAIAGGSDRRQGSRYVSNVVWNIRAQSSRIGLDSRRSFLRRGIPSQQV